MKHCEKEMTIITVKYIVIVAFLTICSVHTCIQTVSLLSLQQMIRINAAGPRSAIGRAPDS